MLFFAGFRLDQQCADLRGPDGQAIKIRPKTFDMLRLFAENAGRVLSKQELMETVWPGVHVGEDSVFQCIREIRTALGDDQRHLIKNISGRGYLLAAEVKGGDALSAEPAETRPPQSAVSSGSVVSFAPEPDAGPAAKPWSWPRLRGPVGIAALVGICAVILLAVAVPIFDPGLISQQSLPTIAVMPIIPAGGDVQVKAMAEGVTDRFTNDLSRIENIRVVARPDVTAHASLAVVGSRVASAEYLVNGELEKGEQDWTLRVRMTRAASGEIAWASTIEVSTDEADLQTQQSRLAAGVGHPLAMQINAMLNDYVPSAAKGASGSAKVAVEQAMASITQTTPERFRAAQVMLEKALDDDPDDVDLQAALAALELRGIQMAWYSPQEREAAKVRGQVLLERALKTKPSYIPVLESYCRFLSATNRFVESMVACARTLSFDPWDGIAIYHIGLNEIFLGRFEDALASFKQADQFDTPAVSRWTWLLGAGVSDVYLGRNEDALPWLQRSLAITPGTGRTHVVLAAAYQRLGRFAEAQAMVKKALELRPGATAENVGPPIENTSPVYLEATKQLKQVLVDAGMRPR